MSVTAPIDIPISKMTPALQRRSFNESSVPWIWLKYSEIVNFVS